MSLCVILVLVVGAALAGIEKPVLGVQTLQEFLTDRNRERCEIDAAERPERRTGIFTHAWIQWRRHRH